jgi:hypothetical protein
MICSISVITIVGTTNFRVSQRAMMTGEHVAGRAGGSLPAAAHHKSGTKSNDRREKFLIHMYYNVAV